MTVEVKCEVLVGGFPGWLRMEGLWSSVCGSRPEGDLMAMCPGVLMAMMCPRVLKML